VATAPATAIAAVLPATSEDVALLREWQSDSRLCTPLRADELCALGRAVIVDPIPADDLERLVELHREAWRDGRYMHETEDAVRAVTAAAIAQDRQRRAERPATPRAEPDEATIVRLWKLARAAF